MGSKSENTSHGFTKSATVGSEPASTEQQRGKRGDDMEEFDITVPLQSETLKDSELNSLFPKKILKYIFSLLPPPDLKAAVLVCRLWSEVGQAPELWNWAAFDVWHACESMIERIQHPRMKEVNLMRIEVCNTNLSCDFMVALAMHPGLRSVHVSHRPCPCANLDDPDLLSYLSYCYHCMCWEKIFSNVPPALFGQAFSNIQEISLESAGLSVDQLNMFCAVIASQQTTKKYLDLIDNRLWDVQPLLLAQAVTKFRHVLLSRIERCASNFVAHGVALFNALGESSSCTMDLNLSGFDLSGVGPDVMAKQIVKLLQFHMFHVPGLTSEQKSAISTAVSDDNCNPSYLKMSLAQLHYVRQFESLCDEIERESSYFTRWRCSMLKERFIPLCFKT